MTHGGHARGKCAGGTSLVATSKLIVLTRYANAN